jgi:UDP-2,4-diacetamido-2,4,6-trideoxy-beta-L-altropyranose hydrolase
MMNIGFRLDANNRMGFGHAYRCSVLADGFSESGYQCTFYTKDYDSLEQIPAIASHTIIEIPDNLSLNGESEWMLREAQNIDVLILDSYELSDAYIASLYNERRLLCCMDDNALYNYNCDIVINVNFFAEDLNIKYNKPIPKFLLGGTYALLRKEFRNVDHIEIKDTPQKAFVCFGGSDPNNYTKFVVETLIENTTLDIVAVLGPATKLAKEDFPQHDSRLSVLKSPQLISEVMAGCDIAVISSGSIVYEMASLGIPSVVVPQADNQLQLVDYLNRHQLMKVIEQCEMYDSSILAGHIHTLCHSTELRRQMSDSMLQLVNRNGATCIINAIEHEMMEKE